ncbi:helix-turn-helix domain-containing protein [Amycolatopsis benzoatilytica]|uniref:helix-turn-helix domain-containing protein n=1 Tax=Amycolatopsis benzoatilytica TaxID=346045 RepID=UPI00037003E5|nr:Scr1 family TA system antitoxin-like transcriptional regulator [Amycolatopsis benzoatilytica]
MPNPRARALGAALRTARSEANLDLPQLARHLGVSPGQLSGWEQGEPVPLPEEVAGILGALGVVGDRKARIRSLARAAAGSAWFTPGTQADRTHYETLVCYERAAERLSVWAPILVPDLLQIPDYARLACGPDLPPEAALEPIVAQRVDRARILSGTEAAFFVGTAALANHFGDADTMLRQVRSLQELAATTEIRVLPSETIAEDAFTLFHGPDPAVYFPRSNTGLFLVDDQAAPYPSIVARLAEAARSPEESLRTLSEVAGEFAGAVRAERRADDAALAEILNS